MNGSGWNGSAMTGHDANRRDVNGRDANRRDVNGREANSRGANGREGNGRGVNGRGAKGHFDGAVRGDAPRGANSGGGNAAANGGAAHRPGNGADRTDALRIVRIANFVTPVSGGLRTALRHLGEGYVAAGHEPVLVVPGAERSDELTPQGRVITLPGLELPGTGGYRVLVRRAPVEALLARLAPDRLEVSDRTTLRWTGEWARRRRVPAVMVSHESADGVLGTWGVPAALARRAGDALNRRSAYAYTRIVCTTAWAEAEFARIGVRNVVRAPLGVDLAAWHPGHRDPAVRARYAVDGEALLVLCSRLSPEKRPGDALDALAHLLGQGVAASLVVAGDGPLRARLAARARAARLPVTFLGHVARRPDLAALLATADVALAPGPVETFGLAALEAMACGTPVVASARSALPALIGSAGAAATTPAQYADAVRRLLAVPAVTRRTAARARAELHPWPAAVAAFLSAHGAPVPCPAGTAPDTASDART